ncbi:MAG: biotin--[acetyl-CoA-carboxylase] ligase [Rhizobiaceae bacterium]
MFTAIEGLNGWRHLSLQSVDSTNLRAFELANQGDFGRVWVTSDIQTAGRARRGRAWVSESGNLYASLLLLDPAPGEQLATLPLVVSLALHMAVLKACPQLEGRLKIKWPNDLLLDGKKISGILLEAQKDTSDRLAVVIGCGVNCSHAPDTTLYPATTLVEAGCSISPIELFRELAYALAQQLRIWSAGQGFSIIRRDWLARCQGLGKPVIARLPDTEKEGRFVDLDEAGLLLLEDDRGLIHKISAADIFFGNSVAKGA